MPQVVALGDDGLEGVVAGGKRGVVGSFRDETGAAEDVDLALEGDDLAEEIGVFAAQKGEIFFHLHHRQARRSGADVGVELALDRAKREATRVVEVIIGDRGAIDKAEIGGAKVVQPVMAVFCDEFGMMAGHAPINDLNGIVRTAANRNPIRRKLMRDLSLVGELNAEDRHALGDRCSQNRSLR
jgi:hypothetical protein